jgi:moderate conductance mechanosensitive channel
VLHVVVASWVEYRLNANFGKVPTSREKTLLNLFKNAFTIALVVFGTMLALAQIGVNIAPLLAGAGVVGLAIGFGAQKLVQDIITGIFIQFENIMNEGDVVAVGNWSGVVEKLTIRSVTIRDLNGTVHLIPFSSVDQVSNMMRGFSYHVAEFGVAYDSNIDVVKAAMQEAFERLMQTEHKDEILDELDMQGITAFRDSAITVRARIKTLPGKQWGTGRRYSELVKTVFAERGIEIPYPHVTYVPAGGPSAPVSMQGRASNAASDGDAE